MYTFLQDILSLNLKKLSRIKYLVVSVFMLVSNIVFADSCPVSCGYDIHITLNSQGQATLIPALILTNYDPLCTDDVTVEAFDVNGNSLGNVVGCNEVGFTIQVEVTNNTINSVCSGTITVVDNLQPIIACDTQFISCGVVSFAPGFVSYPSVSDNCTNLSNSDMSYTDVTSDLDCLTNVNGHLVTAKIERSWSVSDDQGNTSNCIQHIYIDRVNINDIEFPLNFDDNQLSALACNQDDPYDLSLTGQPSVNGVPLDPEGSCEFVITHNDQVVGLCSPNVYKVIRTWQVVDYCTDEFIIDAQIIKVLDKVDPLIICPNNLTIGTNSYDCSATVMLPNANISDNCSGTTQSVSWAFGQGTGPFFNVPLGTYTVDYLATDDCGNTNSCSMEVTIIDDVNPIPICHMATNVGVQDDGQATIYSGTFDDGSTDNCGLAYFEVSRDDFFGDSIVFNCDDIVNSPIDVVVRVYDIHGLFSDVSVIVNVEDNVYPSIVPPSNVSLSCSADFTNLILTGEPTVDDNCGVESITYSDNVNLSCGVGSVLRTWYVEDLYGHVSSANQTITIYDNTPVSVSFPDNVDLYICGANTDPTTMGEPIVIGDDCEQVAIDHADVFFDIAAPACYKIYRTWTVINDCVYNPNDPNSPGIWEHTQVISVFDSVAPILTAPQNIYVGITIEACEVFVDIPLPSVADCSSSITFTNDSPFADSNEGVASGTYGTGSYLIKYFVEDGCGNISNCSLILTVEDAKPPTPVCNFAISISLENDGTVFLTPQLINNNSWDNCTATEDLEITINPSFLTCDDIGEIEVTMTVVDGIGNSSFCTTTVYVQDNLNVCNNVNYYNIAGQLMSFLDQPMANVPIDLEFNNLMQTNTENSGDFIFEDLVSTQTYTLKPNKNDDWHNGVNSYDLIKIGRHVLETEVLDSPYKYLAADINNNQSISGADVVLLRQLLLFNIDTIPGNRSWKFIDADFVFPFGVNPLLADYTEEIIIDNIDSDMNGLDFITVKLGDVTGDAQPNIDSGVDPRNGLDPDVLMVDDLKYEANEDIWVECKLNKNNSIAIQGTMSFDINELDILGVYNLNKMPIFDFFGNRFALNGYITFSVDLISNPEQAHFYVKCKTKKEGLLSTHFKLVDTYTVPRSYTNNGVEKNLVLSFDTKSNELESNDYFIYPNPYTDQFHLILGDYNAGNEIIEIMNALGQIVYSENVTSKELNVNTQKWHEGVYFLVHKMNGKIVYSTQIVKVE